MEKHVQVLGVLFIVLGAMGLIGAFAVLTIFLGGGIAGGIASDEPGIALLVGGFGVVVAIIILITSLPGIIAGYGLTKKLHWGRPLGIIMAVINLPGIPIFTAFGVYGLWVLLNEETKAMFDEPLAPPAP